MESTTAGKSKTFVRAAAISAVLATLALVLIYKGLPGIPLGSLVKSDLPMLALDLRFIDLGGDEVPARQTRLAGIPPAAGKPAAGVSGDCPERTGGDRHGGSLGDDGEERPENCPNTAVWYVKRHPVGVSLSIGDARRLFAFFESDPSLQEIWQSRLVQGMLHDPLQSAGIRAEELGLQGFEGAFLATLVRESLAADARLDYDMVHGRRGFVYSFVRNDCPYAAKALPVIARVLARSGYTAGKLDEPILEMRVGLQRLFLTEYQSRVYLANGLEALLNVLENSSGDRRESPSAPVLLSVDGEAFIARFLQTMTGRDSFRVELGFGLDRESEDFLSFPGGKYGSHLRPKIFKGVLASIPYDAFSAAVTSFYLPPDMTPEAWRRLATEGPAAESSDGPEEGGLAVIWDMSSESEQITEMGVVIATQRSPEAVEQLAAYFADPGLTAECGGGTVFLAATSEMLLARMKESCERQSLSILDWERGAAAERFGSGQLLFFVNPGTGMRELFLAGGAGSDEQEAAGEPWKEQYEQAKASMRKDGEKVFSVLPVFTYAGSVEPDAKVVRLSGVKVRQGAVQ